MLIAGMVATTLSNLNSSPPPPFGGFGYTERGLKKKISAVLSIFTIGLPIMG